MGFFNKIGKKILKNVRQTWMEGVSSLFSRETLEDSFWEELEEMLLLGDVGIDATEDIVETLRARGKEKGYGTAGEYQQEFARILQEFFDAVPDTGKDVPFSSASGKAGVILLVGINGSGKTTTAAKLAWRCRQQGISPVLAACDTFRAAAIDQLKIWGERMDSRVIAQPYGSDPGAVLFDALRASQAARGGIAPVIADTAGRLHNKQNLMAELGKIHRIALREADHVETLLVLDTITGQNGLQQALSFHECIPITGVVLTKFDNTAKGGIVLSIARELRLPIRYVGLGEGMEDLELFSPQDFISALLEKKDRHEE